MAKVYTQYLMAISGLLALTACRNEATTFVPTNTDKFVFYSQDYYEQAAQLLQADYLIVQDMSYSMNASQETVRQAISQFAGYLDNSEIDYKIGFVRGTNQSRVNSQTLAFWESTIPSTFLGGVLTPASISSILNQVASSIAGNSANEVVILEAAKRTLAAQGASFLRDAAQLVYVFISDNDDESRALLGGARSPSQYASALKSFKKHSTYVNARAFVYNDSSCQAPAQHGQGPGDILAEAAQLTNSDGPSRRCLSQYSSMAASLEDMARNVTKPTTRFALRATPVPSSVTLLLDNQVTAQNDVDHPWSYNASTNEIVFPDNYEPDPESPLEIQYDMVMKLSRQPRLETMVVTVAGNLVPQSSVSYNAATREISIGGGFAPRHNETIVVNYEVK